MLLAPSVVSLFKWRQFDPEVILLAVGWYLRFSLSYRDVEELLAERGLLVDPSPSGGGFSAPELNRRVRKRQSRKTAALARIEVTFYSRLSSSGFSLYRGLPGVIFALGHLHPPHRPPDFRVGGALVGLISSLLDRHLEIRVRHFTGQEPRQLHPVFLTDREPVAIITGIVTCRRPHARALVSVAVE